MRKILLLLLMFPFLLKGNSPVSSGALWQQSNGTATYPNKKIALFSEQDKQVKEAQKFISDQLRDHFSINTTLYLEDFRTSFLGTHITFTQAFFDTPIYGTNVKVNIAKDGQVSSLHYKLVPSKNIPAKAFSAQADMKQIAAYTENAIISKLQKTWYYNGENIQQAFLIDFGKQDGTLHNEAVISTTYDLLYSIDKHRYTEKKDTLVTALVFLPDPLTSANKPYGAPYADFNDSAVFELDLERRPLEMQITYGDSTFLLENQYSRIVEMSSPATVPTTSILPFFNYSREDAGFEDVNVMYHIYNYRQHIKNIGFDTLGKISLRIDAHALSGADQSEFDFFNDELKLLFGEGGIDDAEDADVIIHEYSHYLSFAASGDNAYGTERLAIEEGLCDYFACSYSKRYSDYNWKKVYNWDGNETWNGRSCTTSKNYKRDLTGNRYRDAEIWAGTLMGLQQEIGRDTTDALMLGTLYLLSKYISMPNTAKQLILVDSALYGGIHVPVITRVFTEYGILSDSNSSIVQDAKQEVSFKIFTQYFQSHNLVYAEFNTAQSGIMQLIDLQGKEIYSERFSGKNKLNVYVPQIKPGMYILNIATEDIHQSVKLLK